MRLAIAGLPLGPNGGHVVVKKNSVAIRFEIFFFLYQPPTWQTKNCFRVLHMSETFVYSRGSFLMTNMSQKPAFLNMPGLKSMKAMFDSKI